MNKPVGPEGIAFDPAHWLPPEIGKITDHQTDLPRIAKDPKLTAAIEAQLSQIPTTHDLHLHDSRAIDFLAPNSIHLVVTSPPYWTLKEYNNFWKTRSSQHTRQGSGTGRKDAGNRAAVTGGKHADGFVKLIAAIVRDAGLRDVAIYTTEKSPRTLPGFFRPTKEWDVVVVARSDLVAAIEVKSQVGSFGNNFNNRVEEALGNATDLWTAYSKGVFEPSQKPWLGYLFMLEEHEKSIRPTKRINLKPFKVDEAFQQLSYAERYELVCQRLVREQALRCGLLLHLQCQVRDSGCLRSAQPGTRHPQLRDLSLRTGSGVCAAAKEIAAGAPVRCPALLPGKGMARVSSYLFFSSISTNANSKSLALITSCSTPAARV